MTKTLWFCLECLVSRIQEDEPSCPLCHDEMTPGGWMQEVGEKSPEGTSDSQPA